MNIRTTTLFAIFGISIKFVVKSTITLFPGIFSNIQIAQTVQIISLICSASVLLFFVSLYMEYEKQDKVKLKQAAGLGIIGASLLLIPVFKGLLLAFNNYASVHIIKFFVQIQAVLVIIPSINSVLVLLFFIIFYLGMISEDQKALYKAALFGMSGSASGLLVNLFTLLNYYHLKIDKGYSVVPAKVFIFTAPLIILSFAGVLYFLIIFYKEQRTVTSLS